MRKQQLSDIVWREVRWQRPYKLETVWEVLSHLASTRSEERRVGKECRL